MYNTVFFLFFFCIKPYLKYSKQYLNVSKQTYDFTTNEWINEKRYKLLFFISQILELFKNFFNCLTNCFYRIILVLIIDNCLNKF